MQTLLGLSDPDDVTDDVLNEHLLGFSIADHAQISDILRANGWQAQLFVAASMLARACSAYERKLLRSEATGRNREAVDIAARSVEATLTGAARIATDILLSNGAVGTRGISMLLADNVERFRRSRSVKSVTHSVRLAARTANAIHLFLTRGPVQDKSLNYDRDPEQLPNRLATRNVAAEASVQAMLDEVAAVDANGLYALLMARRLEVALARHPWLAAPHPIFRLSYGYIGGHALFAECERLGVITRTMADRQRQQDGSKLDSATMRPVLASPPETSGAIHLQTAAGRYLDLGAYHAAVTTSFIKRKGHWMATTVPAYTHHAYATGSRFCNLGDAALDASTHDFIRRTEWQKPTERGTRTQDLVLFYGLDVEDTIILALRQITDRLYHRNVNGDIWRIAFGRTVHRILSHVAPEIAARLEMTSCLKTNIATCKGLRNRAIELAKRFDDHDYERPVGVFFDYALWFDRDRDVDFWDRLQKGASLYKAFGSSFIPPSREPLPGRQGRRPTPADAPPSRWQGIMTEAKKAFDAYQPLYLKSRPTRLTARIMARMCQGYSAFASDPQFSTVFKT